MLDADDEYNDEYNDVSISPTGIKNGEKLEQVKFYEN